MLRQADAEASCAALKTCGTWDGGTVPMAQADRERGGSTAKASRGIQAGSSHEVARWESQWLPFDSNYIYTIESLVTRTHWGRLEA